ncbi:ribonuclease G [Caldicellulosiruptor bescii]|jgi:ribonuclease G|uniref:Ribonuclease G n=2 Tax=Caldicellulosiruptor bescii TaxID=31899 RepID=B9MLY1_CALBD|nr:Rne/Rng family ribonuclease [Caldicellulosiruptor bescii]ACM61204.1 ribonuclease, Rne/Rng family [Caldicellulosiruptor bescii DSM 6725]PBC88983.1 ribonuclease G [Caldicellulosiruptor bescii]PBC91535.1 ribonuclease G [Caldicellulosiruptor bescii]PBD03052.1 ribonuclease G [Caldicellulosiruptor bescii]PBD07333.1 ribonuclease G [Caldicellulosiruptor bescii]
MQSEIIVDVSFNQTRVAVLEDKELVEIYIEREDSQSIVGNIYKGVVENILPGMDAAFVNIGQEKNAFLYLGDVNRLEFGDTDEYYEIKTNPLALRCGQEIVVQVIKEGYDQKGPRVTTNITLPGRYLVLLPCTEYVGVSKRIESEEERQRLKEIACRIRPEGMGLIVRTAAENKSEEILKSELEFLKNMWKKIRQKSCQSAPVLLYKDYDLVFKAVRDMFTNQVDRFVINDRKKYNKIIEFLSSYAPSLKSKVEYFNLATNIFEYFQIEQKLSKALSKRVWLKSGGYIVIDETEALTVIDVNTGKYVGKTDVAETILKTNLEAAQEIARQLRLRDIGGIIIIDFIDMKNPDHQKIVLDALKEALKRDKTKTVVVDITPLGLVEMTRKKVRQRLSCVMQSNCPYCEGTGKILSPESVAFKVLKEIEWYCKNKVEDKFFVEIHTKVCEILRKGEIDRIKELEQKYKKKIYIKASSNIHINKFTICPVKDEDHYMALCGWLCEGDEVLAFVEEEDRFNPKNAVGYVNQNRIELDDASDLVGKYIYAKVEKVYGTLSKGKILDVYEVDKEDVKEC